MNDAERLTRLEERYVHLQRHVVQQDQAMLALSDELAKLRRELAQLCARDQGDAPAGDPPDARPPHY